MEPITVLLAEDHAVVREATAEIVDHQSDMRVVGQAGTGDEAVQLARRLRPDVVVMDIAMPHLDGLEATSRIAAECPACHVLVLTAREEEHYIIELLQAGAIGYLPKTVALDELLDAIRAVARGDSVLPPRIASVVVRHLTEEETTESRKGRLTDRELEVLELAGDGLTNHEIAQRLHISIRTVEAHLTHVYDKLGVASRTQAVVSGMQQGLICPGTDH
ncbi:MAG: response regulator transcription factor [Anaerolineae bacterium]|jgi:DNA-binding NarL/FixJ family response regulator